MADACFVSSVLIPDVHVFPFVYGLSAFTVP